MIDQTSCERWNSYDSFDLYCDSCDFSQTFDDMDFTSMIKEAKDYGWTIRKVNNDWEHYCPTCSEKGVGKSLPEANTQKMEDEHIAGLND